MLERLEAHYGAHRPSRGAGSSAPAARFRLPDGTTFGIISSTSQPFCRTCDRARLTADGVFLLCLYAQHGTDLRRPLRAGASAETLLRLIRAVWEGRADRGAEERLAHRERGAYIPLRCSSATRIWRCTRVGGEGRSSSIGCAWAPPTRGRASARRLARRDGRRRCSVAAAPPPRAVAPRLEDSLGATAAGASCRSGPPPNARSPALEDAISRAAVARASLVP